MGKTERSKWAGAHESVWAVREWSCGDASDIDGKTERSICAGAHESISKQATEIGDMTNRRARVERGGSQQNSANFLLAPSCLSSR